MEIYFQNKFNKNKYFLSENYFVNSFGNVIETWEDEDEDGTLQTDSTPRREFEAFVIVNGNDFVICKEEKTNV